MASDTRMAEIERRAQDFAAAQTVLSQELEGLQEEIDSAKARRIKRLRRQVHAVSDAKSRLLAAVRMAPDAFRRPKSRTLHGVRVGFQKGKGKLAWADDARLVAAIRRLLPDQAETLIKTTAKPLKGPLSRLSARLLKRLGVTVTDTGNQAFAAPVSGDLEKLVEALLGDADKGGADGD